MAAISSMTSPRRFSNQTFSEEDLNAALEAGCTGSKVLDLSGADLSDADSALFLADALLRNRLFDFENVNLNSTRLNTDGLDTLVTVLLEMPALESFQIRGCGLSKESGSSFSKLLVKSGLKLQSLDIRDNRLGDIGIAAIAGAFASDLSFLPAPSSSGTATLSILSLRSLDLSGNDLGDMAVLALCRGFTQLARNASAGGRCSQLKSLSLHGNKLGDKSCHCLAQLISLCSVPPPPAAAAAAAPSLGLEELGLNDNINITARGMSALLRTSQDVNRVSPLRQLSLARCQPSLEVVALLAVVLQSPHCRLESVQLQFTDEAATLAIEAARSRDVSDMSLTSFGSISDTMRSLAAACSSSSSAPSSSSSSSSSSNRLSISLGQLPQAMRLACIAAEASASTDQGSLFMDLYGALEALFNASYAVVLPLDVRAWIINEIQPRHHSVSSSSSPAKPIVFVDPSGSGSSTSSSSRNVSFSSLPSSSSSKAQLHVMPLVSHAHSAVLAQQEMFEHVRKEHSRAFSLLSSEIKKMAEFENSGEKSLPHSGTDDVSTPQLRSGGGNGSPDGGSADSTPFSFGVAASASSSFFSTPVAAAASSSSSSSFSFSTPVAAASSSVKDLPSTLANPSPPFTALQLETIGAMIVRGQEQAQSMQVSFLTERIQHHEAQILLPSLPPAPAPAELPPAVREQLRDFDARLARVEETLIVLSQAQKKAALGDDGSNHVMTQLTLAKRLDRMELRMQASEEKLGASLATLQSLGSVTHKREGETSRSVAKLSARLSSLEEAVEEDQVTSLALYDALLQHSAKKQDPTERPLGVGGTPKKASPAEPSMMPPPPPPQLASPSPSNRSVPPLPFPLPLRAKSPGSQNKDRARRY